MSAVALGIGSLYPGWVRPLRTTQVEKSITGCWISGPLSASPAPSGPWQTLQTAYPAIGEKGRSGPRSPTGPASAPPPPLAPPVTDTDASGFTAPPAPPVAPPLPPVFFPAVPPVSSSAPEPPVSPVAPRRGACDTQAARHPAASRRTRVRLAGRHSGWNMNKLLCSDDVSGRHLGGP